MFCLPLTDSSIPLVKLSKLAKHHFPHLHHDECVLTIMVTGCHVGGIPFCDCCEAIMVPVPPPGKQHVQTGVPHKELVRNIDISRTVLMTMFQ